jgi:pimeloyl-ACP methyl ester carboxylesterase
MAEDLVALVHKRLSVPTSFHLVGHDIGGMIAHAYASRHPDLVSSII